MTEFQILDPDPFLQKQRKQVPARGPNGRFAGPFRQPRGPAARHPQPARAADDAAPRWLSLPPARGAVELALDGHRLARELCVAWFIPARRSRPIRFDLRRSAMPPMSCWAGSDPRSCGASEIAPSEGVSWRAASR